MRKCNLMTGEISLCSKCGCMTNDILGSDGIYCGKCKARKIKPSELLKDAGDGLW